MSLRKFNSWSKRESYGRRLICHFYIAESKNQYYDKSDYAHFNLFSDAKEWIVKGTANHGIKSQRGKSSHVPCLNCFELDDKFYDGLKTLDREGNDKFEFGIILNKRKLANIFNVIDVSIKHPSEHPTINKCHYYDNPRARKGVLQPFHYCDVVRVEIPKTNLESAPIANISPRLIVGALCKKGEKRIIAKLLKPKKVSSKNIFPLL